MAQLAVFHECRHVRNVVQWITVYGFDQDVPCDLVDFQLTGEHIGQLEEGLIRSRAEGRPFDEVVIDAYGDLLPEGVSENDNAFASRAMRRLEGVAVRSGAALTLVHHASTKAESASGRDIRSLARGATALTAKARTIFTLEECGEGEHVRRMRCATNLGRPPGTVFLQIASGEGEPGEILYFRPFDRFADFDPWELLPHDGSPITTSDLARRIAGIGEDQTPTGEQKRRAAALRTAWEAKGLISVEPGPRRAKRLRLVATR